MHLSIRDEAKQKIPPEEIQAPPEVVPTRKRKEKKPQRHHKKYQSTIIPYNFEIHSYAC